MDAASERLDQLTDEPLFHRPVRVSLSRQGGYESNRSETARGGAFTPGIVAKLIGIARIRIKIEHDRNFAGSLGTHKPQINWVRQSPLQPNEFSLKVWLLIRLYDEWRQGLQSGLDVGQHFPVFDFPGRSALRLDVFFRF